MILIDLFNKRLIHRSLYLLGLLTLTFTGTISAKEYSILNVSYDVSRELYKDINVAFSDYWLKKTGDKVNIQQSHDGSSKQAAAVIAGLEADVVTMNQETDIDKIATKGLISKDWLTRFPDNSAPYTSTTVFLVRKGNPKNIKDWDDLIKADNAVILSNPKTSGNARYSYLAAWGYALRKSGSEEKAREFITQLFKHVPVLNTGGRAATNTFIQNNTGDVLLTFENEAFLIAKDLGADKFDVIVPSTSIEAEHPVAIINPVAAKKGTQKVAEAYLEFLWTDAGQEIIAKHHYRPRNPEILARHADQFAHLELFSIKDIIPGGWPAAQRIHFADGGLFDQIYSR
ncbi:sulfate ABC transporter substrate-binding protein [Methylobacter sp. S3L5C]|nr:sulfate ABC transporter substrate-binding protein [Methylobacter sp. S3L5C]